jgi:hypothetical protein
MSTAILPSRAAASSGLASALECEACHSTAMTVSPNPYFGTGLAVHRHIAVCDGCGAVAFVPEPVPVPSMVERLVAYVRSFFSGTAQA